MKVEFSKNKKPEKIFSPPKNSNGGSSNSKSNPEKNRKYERAAISAPSLNPFDSIFKSEISGAAKLRRFRNMYHYRRLLSMDLCEYKEMDSEHCGPVLYFSIDKVEEK